jgi:hypothetical protein
MSIRQFLKVVIFSLLFPCLIHAQSSSIANDSTKTRSLEIPTTSLTSMQVFRRNSLGLDVLISSGGFGLGTFYRHEYSDVLSSFIDFSISEAGDDDEKEYIDYYGDRYTPGKVNRFLVLPLFAGLEKRLFKDDIVDNFRPYITAAAGPSMIYIFPYDQEFFTGIGKGTPKYTFGGYIGLGAYFGSEYSNFLGLNMRYYFLPYPGGLEDLQGQKKTEFGGFYISLKLGSAL